jgi:predicted metal-dependent hydrolase
MVPAYIEPYLIKVLRRAKEQLGDGHPALVADIEIFNRQEAQHYKQHAAFNRVIRASGYEGMLEYEQAYDADYQRFLTERSLKFNLAYCEGFEALGSAAAPFFLDDIDDLLDDADPAVVELWSWHLAEEFEHRTVCHEVYKALYGRGVRAYLYRVWAFLYATRHIGGHTSRLNEYLLATDRADMTEAELAESRRRAKAYEKRRIRKTIPRLLKVLSPTYDPGKLPPPRRLDKYLDAY